MTGDRPTPSHPGNLARGGACFTSLPLARHAGPGAGLPVGPDDPTQRHEMRAKQPHLVAQLPDLSAPEVRPAAGFHRDNTRWHLAEERQHLTPPQLLAQNRTAHAVSPMHLDRRGAGGDKHTPSGGGHIIRAGASYHDVWLSAGQGQESSPDPHPIKTPADPGILVIPAKSLNFWRAPPGEDDNYVYSIAL